MDYANLKKRCRVGDLNLPERRRYTNGRVQKEVGAQNCLPSKAMEDRTYVVADCDLYKEEQDLLTRDMWEAKEGGMKSFRAVDECTKMMALPRKRWK